MIVQSQVLSHIGATEDSCLVVLSCLVPLCGSSFLSLVLYLFVKFSFAVT